VRDNVYWETRSCIERRNAPPLSKDTSSGITGPITGDVAHSDGTELALAIPTPGESGGVEPFQPNASQESNAWEVIQKWHYVAEERRNRRPNFDIYNSVNDECISTNSLLTYSVTDAPSTGGRSNRFALFLITLFCALCSDCFFTVIVT